MRSLLEQSAHLSLGGPPPALYATILSVIVCSCAASGRQWTLSQTLCLCLELPGSHLQESKAFLRFRVRYVPCPDQ